MYFYALNALTLILKITTIKLLYRALGSLDLAILKIIVR